MLSLDTGKLLCWGAGLDPSDPNKPGQRFHDIACGLTHTCGVTREGTLACVGFPRMNKAQPPQGNDFVKVAVSEEHGCALRKDGQLACWTVTESKAITPPSADDRYTSIAAGDGFTCGVLRGDGALTCWGTPFRSSLPSPAVTGTLGVSAGSYQGCVVRADRSASCWGFGSIGITRLSNVTQLSVSGDYQAVEAPKAHACALVEDGRAFCWEGSGPMEIPGGPFLAIGAGPFSACTLSATGKLACKVDPGYEKIFVNTAPSDADVATVLRE